MGAGDRTKTAAMSASTGLWPSLCQGPEISSRPLHAEQLRPASPLPGRRQRPCRKYCRQRSSCYSAPCRAVADAHASGAQLQRPAESSHYQGQGGSVTHEKWDPVQRGSHHQLLPSAYRSAAPGNGPSRAIREIIPSSPSLLRVLPVLRQMIKTRDSRPVDKWTLISRKTQWLSRILSTRQHVIV
jgi:hypothetical protein